MASVMAIGCQFDNTKRSIKNKYETKTVKILSQLSVDKSLPHYCYLFETDHGVIKIPAFELARTLFFHNRHLIKAAYSANGLTELAILDETVSPVKIHFPKSTTFPVSNLALKKARTHFVWLILDPEARKSFFSIYQFFRENPDSICFNFSPPSLKSWVLKLAIVNDESNAVTEVKRVESILYAPATEKFNGVEIIHPKKEFIDESEGSGSQKKPGKTPPVNTDPELDLGAVSGFGKRRHIDRTSHFSFSISGIDGVYLAEGQLKAGKPKSSNGTQPEPDKAGVGPPAKEGKAQEFDPTLNQNNDDFKETTEFPHKFLMFEKVVKDLGNLSDIKLESVKCGEFPFPMNGSKVILKTKDGKCLRFFIAAFEIKSNNIIILEADTTSLEPAKGSGTLILGLKEDATKHFKEIIQNFADRGAQWQSVFIEDRSSYFVSCSHPRIQSKTKVFTEDEYKTTWTRKLTAELNKLLED